MKSNLLLDVYAFSGLFCIESDVNEITSIFGDLISSSSLIRIKDRFCSFSNCFFICCKAAARDFDRNDPFGFCCCLSFPDSIGLESLWHRMLLSSLRWELLSWLLFGVVYFPFLLFSSFLLLLRLVVLCDCEFFMTVEVLVSRWSFC